MPTSRFSPARSIVLVLFLAAACGEPPASPAPPVASTPVLSRDGSSPVYERGPGLEHGPNGQPYGLVRCSGRRRLEATAVIGPEGGTIRIGPNAVTIPAGALDERVLISARVEDTIAAVHFEPHGLRFRLPVRLVLDTRGCAVRAEQDPVLLYLDDGGEARETIDGFLNEVSQKFYAPIEHFSVYAIGV